MPPAVAAPVPGSDPVQRVGPGFLLLYASAYMGTILLFLAPLLVSLSLKINSLVGIDRAPAGLALVAGTGALLAMVANPFFGRLSDRTTSTYGRRRPWMVIGLAGGSGGILLVALAPNLLVVLLGWCLAQVFFNALLAALGAVLPDQVPAGQRGKVAGVLGVCLPVASVCGTYLVQLFSGHDLAVFLVPCGTGALLVLLFAVRLDDTPITDTERPPWTWRELVGTFYVDPRRNADFTWVFVSRFLFVLAYALLTTYQTYYLIETLGTPQAHVARQVFLGTATMASAVLVSSLLGGAWSDRTGRRKVFVGAASSVFAVALLVIAVSGDLGGYLLGMAVAGLGFGLYTAVDLALVADVLPDRTTAAKDLGVMNIAGALPSSVAPALAPVVLVLGGGSYSVLYMVAGISAVLAAISICPLGEAREWPEPA